MFTAEEMVLLHTIYFCRIMRLPQNVFQKTGAIYISNDGSYWNLFVVS